jgi:hypothetical protein
MPSIETERNIVINSLAKNDLNNPSPPISQVNSIQKIDIKTSLYLARRVAAKKSIRSLLEAKEGIIRAAKANITIVATKGLKAGKETPNYLQQVQQKRYSLHLISYHI